METQLAQHYNVADYRERIVKEASPISLKRF